MCVCVYAYLVLASQGVEEDSPTVSLLQVVVPLQDEGDLQLMWEEEEETAGGE